MSGFGLRIIMIEIAQGSKPGVVSATTCQIKSERLHRYNDAAWKAFYKIGSIRFNHFDLKMISFMRSNFGDTTGTVSMVLATAISSSAVKVSLVMMLLSNNILTKMITIIFVNILLD